MRETQYGCKECLPEFYQLKTNNTQCIRKFDSNLSSGCRKFIEPIPFSGVTAYYGEGEDPQPNCFPEYEFIRSANRCMLPMKERDGFIRRNCLLLGDSYRCILCSPGYYPNECNPKDDKCFLCNPTEKDKCDSYCESCDNEGCIIRRNNTFSGNDYCELKIERDSLVAIFGPCYKCANDYVLDSTGNEC